MIFYLLFIILGLVVYKIVLKPIVPLLLLKLQLGKQAYLWYYPFWGGLKYHKDSFIQKGDFFGKIKEIARENPEIKVILSNLMDKPFLQFVGSEYVKYLYTNHQLFGKFNVLKYDDLLDKGLLMTEDEEWKHQRHSLGQAFTFEKLKARIPMINEVVRARCRDDPKISSFDFISWITGEVVLNSFFGDLSKELRINGRPAQVEIVQLFGDIMRQRLNNKYTTLKLMLLFGSKGWKIISSKNESAIVKRVDELRSTVRSLIEKRLSQLKQEKQLIVQEDMNFLDIYLYEYLRMDEQVKRMDIEEVIQQFITLFFAGTDTTATMSVTCLVFLAQYPEAQQDLLDEILSVVGDADVQDIHLPKLIKMNAFIQEVFRLKNPAFSPFIRYVKQDMQVLDVKLKKGWLVVQRHDIPEIRYEHFTDPNTFDYKRFLDGNPIKNDNGFVHVPFGAGARNCIGQHMALMELKIILSHVLRLYKVRLNQNTQVKFGLKFLYGVEPDNCLIYEQRK